MDRRPSTRCRHSPSPSEEAPRLVAHPGPKTRPYRGFRRKKHGQQFPYLAAIGIPTREIGVLRMATDGVDLVIESHVLAIHIVKNGGVQQRVIERRVKYFPVFFLAAGNLHVIECGVPDRPRLLPNLFQGTIADLSLCRFASALATLTKEIPTLTCNVQHSNSRHSHTHRRVCRWLRSPRRLYRFHRRYRSQAAFPRYES